MGGSTVFVHPFLEIFGNLCTVITRTAKKMEFFNCVRSIRTIRYTEITVVHHRRGKWHKK